MFQVMTSDQFKDVCLELAKLYLAENDREQASSWNALPKDIQQQLLNNVQDLTRDESYSAANSLQTEKEAILRVYESFKIKVGICNKDSPENDSGKRSLEEKMQLLDLRDGESLAQSGCKVARVVSDGAVCLFEKDRL